MLDSREAVDRLTRLILKKGSDNKSAVAELCAFVDDPSYLVRAGVTIGLFTAAQQDRLKAESIGLAVDTLLLLVKDKNPGVQGNAATGLVYIAIHCDFIEHSYITQIIKGLCDLSISSPIRRIKEDVKNNILAVLEHRQNYFALALACASSIDSSDLAYNIKDLAGKYGRFYDTLVRPATVTTLSFEGGVTVEPDSVRDPSSH